MKTDMADGHYDFHTEENETKRRNDGAPCMYRCSGSRAQELYLSFPQVSLQPIIFDKNKKQILNRHNQV